MAEPAELVDPGTDCGNDWTRLTSKPVRRMQVLITACMFFVGTALLSVVVRLPWTDPTPRTIALVMCLLWALLTGVAFLASLRLWLAEEPELLISRPCILSEQPIALRWRLPAGIKKRTLKIELCGQEEWTHVVRRDTQAEIYRFLTLALVDVPESVEEREGVVHFRTPRLAASFKEENKKGAHKIRYWIGVRNIPGKLSSFEYAVTVSDSPGARPDDR